MRTFIFQLSLLFQLFTFGYLSTHTEFKLNQVFQSNSDVSNLLKILIPNNEDLEEAGRLHNTTFIHSIKIDTSLLKKVEDSRQKVFSNSYKHRILPNITDKATVLNLAKMSYNAYLEFGNKDWFDLTKNFTATDQFGWKEDGIRGYVFADPTNSTVVLALKGTSAGLVSGDSKTSAKDKLNDNLMYSCCCARVDPTWSKVCNCYQGGNKCSLTCIEDAVSINSTDVYYYAAQSILTQVEDFYPKADIWLTGHSLGGGLAAILGLSYGLPTVTFQAPGDLLAARRLHLPNTAGNLGDVPIWHFGHNSDPIFLGECTGPLSACYIGGYALESKCHTGKVCIYDTKTHKKWGSDILKHRISNVIDEVISTLDVPECVEQSDCQDCVGWDIRDPVQIGKF